MGTSEWKLILCITSICFYSATYNTLFGSLFYNKNVAHKYLLHMANSSIQIYSIENYISLIDICLNYIYWIGI
jgi:hypothetical protein